ncbi:arylesterase [Noviherbaspirillum agri]
MLRQLTAFTLFLLATTAYSASNTVLVLGDSLSAEYGLTRGSGWVPLLEKRLKDERINASIVNASISGETTGGGRVRLPALLERHQPDVVIIELGANDGLRGLPLSAAEANLRTMITESRSAKAKVLLVGMQLPPNYGKEYTEKFITLFSSLARSTGTPLVPFLLHGIADQPHMFQSDRIHPAAEAQPIMLENIWPFLKPLLAK